MNYQPNNKDMEERILKIINDKFYQLKNRLGKMNTGQFKLQTAREITALIQSEYVEKEFVDWYSGMERAKIEKAYLRYLKEVKGK
jgi:hypothetical protein